MEENGMVRGRQDALLVELEGIRDVYRLDVGQFIAFLRSRKLPFVEGFRQYAQWLDGEHEGKRYSPATVNRKLSAARNRVRYAFKRSTHADSLQRKYQLEDILKSVKLKKIDAVAIPSSKVLDIEEARRLIRMTKDRTIRLMETFLLRTGVRVSEMLGLRLDAMGTAAEELVPVRVRGKAGKERIIHVKKDFVEQIRTHFAGQTYLFEHQGRSYNRISVTNRIKHESLRILGKEVSAQQLRYTWASIQINRGKGVRAVAAVLGHADPGSTARICPGAPMEPEESFLDLEEAPRPKDKP